MSVQQASIDCELCKARTLHTRHTSSGCAILAVLALVLSVLAFPFVPGGAMLVGGGTLVLAVFGALLSAPPPYCCSRCGTAAPQIDGLALRLVIAAGIGAVAWWAISGAAETARARRAAEERLEQAEPEEVCPAVPSSRPWRAE